jgi:hypothetical protein
MLVQGHTASGATHAAQTQPPFAIAAELCRNPHPSPFMPSQVAGRLVFCQGLRAPAGVPRAQGAAEGPLPGGLEHSPARFSQSNCAQQKHRSTPLVAPDICHFQPACFCVSMHAPSGGRASGRSGPASASRRAKGPGGSRGPGALAEGSPLPDNGACKHYRHSYRWLRFPCCGELGLCGWLRRQALGQNFAVRLVNPKHYLHAAWQGCDAHRIAVCAGFGQAQELPHLIHAGIHLATDTHARLHSQDWLATDQILCS